MVSRRSNNLIELIKEMMESWNAIEKSFWDEKSSKVLSMLSSFVDLVANSSYNIVKSLSVELRLLTEQDHVSVSS